MDINATPRHDDALILALTGLSKAYQSLTQNRHLTAKANQLKHGHQWLHIHQALRYLALLGDETEHFLHVSEKEVMKTIRVNTLKTDKSTLRERLEKKGFIIEQHPYIDYGLVVKKAPYSIGATPEYLTGLYTIQGPASMLAVPALEPLSKSTLIIDMCSGAGVKTTQISQHAPRTPIIALDINRRKLAALKNNTSRLGVANITAYHADARKLAELIAPQHASHILLDAPCSGEGLIPYSKGKWPRSFDDIISRVTLQYQLVKAAVEALKPRGVLVYSTCTISVEENEYVLTQFTKRGLLQPDKPPINGGSSGVTNYLGLEIDQRLRWACRRFFPHRHHTEGFTICRLRKPSYTPAAER